MVGGDQAGIGDDLAPAFFLQGLQLDVQIEIASQQGVGNARRGGGRGEGLGRQIDVQPARRVGIAARTAADRAGVGAVVVAAAPADAELRTQIAGESIGRDDDAPFDQHLIHRSIDDADQLAHLRDLLRNVADHQRIRALVGNDAATRRQEAVFLLLPVTGAATRTAVADALRLGDRFEDRRGIVVVDLDVVGAQILAILDRDAGIFLVLLELGQFLLRRDPNDAPFTTLVQALGAQDDIQRLIPGYVDQAQGDIALHGVGSDDVEVGFLGDQLQYGADRHVLEVERDRAPAVSACVLRGRHLGRRTRDAACGRAAGSAHRRLVGPRRDFDHVLVAGLVGQRFESALRAQHQLGALAARAGIHPLHRGREIDHVQAALQAGWNFGIADVHHHRRSQVAQVGRGAIAVELDHQPAGAILAPPEVDVGDRHLPCRLRAGRSGCGAWRGGSRRGYRVGRTGYTRGHQQADGETQALGPERSQAPDRPQAISV